MELSLPDMQKSLVRLSFAISAVLGKRALFYIPLDGYAVTCNDPLIRSIYYAAISFGKKV
jgi:hypothetical protein